MKELSYRSVVEVSTLPPPTSTLAGVIVQLTSDNNKPYFCNGSSWIDLSSIGGGSLTLTEVSLNFGTSAVTSKKFTFAEANALTSKKIMMQALPESDEHELTAFVCQAYCETDGYITVFIHSLFGPVKGTYKFNYLIG